MDNCAMSIMRKDSLKGNEDLNRIDLGLSCFADNSLRLSSYNAQSLGPGSYEEVACKRRWSSFVETLDPNNELSLALELGCSGGGPSCSKGDCVVPDTILASRRDAEGLIAGMCLEFNVGKRPCEDVNENGTMIAPGGNERLKVDLELSLSTVAGESDLTSITQASSHTQFGKEPFALSSIEQLVDEGSTSSKWKRGPLVPLIDSLQALNALVPLEGKGSFMSALSNLPSVSVIDEADTPRSTRQRKTSVRTCQSPGCQKGARGASGHCISHGGGRRCQKPGCQKGAEGKTVFCKAHGGGRRCEYLGCTKSAEGRTNLCIAHGGGRRCTSPGGCTHAARGKSEFCIRHGGGKRCKMVNCTKSAEGLSSLCIAHGGGRRCQFPQCTKGAQGSTKFCKSHGGGKRCTFPGCTKGAEGSTSFCKGHGGGKRCFFRGGDVCTKSGHGGTLYCVSHGGGKRCGVSGCTKSARGRTDFCVLHGGGKRCKAEGCGKSAQGSTDFCKAHGGGNRCLWGQPDSAFGADGATPCDKFARGKISLCAAHNAQVQDKRVHGNGTVGLKMKGTDTDTDNLVEDANNMITGEGSSSFWNEYSFGVYGHGLGPMQMNLSNDKRLLGGSNDSSNPGSLPEGRVHGGGLMAMLKRC